MPTDDQLKLAEAVDKIGGEGYCPGPLLVCAECGVARVFQLNGREHCSRCEKEVETLYKPVPKPIPVNLPVVEKWLLETKETAKTYGMCLQHELQLPSMGHSWYALVCILRAPMELRLKAALAAFEKVLESGEEKNTKL